MNQYLRIKEFLKSKKGFNFFESHHLATHNRAKTACQILCISFRRLGISMAHDGSDLVQGKARHPSGPEGKRTVRPSSRPRSRIKPVLSNIEGPVLSNIEGPVLSNIEGPVLSSIEGPVLSSVEGPVLSQATGVIELSLHLPLRLPNLQYYG
jgi:hypothetical protein